MVKCLVCGSEQEVGEFCASCGSPMNLDYPKPTQMGQKSIIVQSTSFPKRIFLVLFQEDVRADICQNNYNLEIFFIYALMFGITVFRLYFQFFVQHQSFKIGVPLMNFFLQAFIMSVAIFGVIILITYVFSATFFKDRNITINQIFRIYTYTYLSDYFIISIISPLIYFLIFRIGGTITLLLTESLLGILIMAIGYKSLFKTNYFIAAIIFLVALMVGTYFSLFILVAFNQIGL